MWVSGESACCICVKLRVTVPQTLVKPSAIAVILYTCNPVASTVRWENPWKLREEPAWCMQQWEG